MLIAQCAAIILSLTCNTTSSAAHLQTDPPPAAPKADQLFTVEEVASRLKLSKARIYELVRTGEIRAMHQGKYWRVRPTEVERFIAKNEGI
jgi:excisionase family DNA binding protein